LIFGINPSGLGYDGPYYFASSGDNGLAMEVGTFNGLIYGQFYYLGL
jgi:hypothetical protein